jgi:Cd2+/Zn2+-exporting ATPase
MKQPYIFDEFFASGKEESISPFLTPSSRKWGRNISLKASLLSAVLLLGAFISSFFHPTASSLMLIGVYFISGTPALIDALDDLNNVEINIDVLMTIAALLSVLIGSPLEGALLLVLFELSASIENAVTKKTRGTLHNLSELAPASAAVVGENGLVYDRSVKEITVGTHLLIRAGEIVPLDGDVTEGSSFVNLVHLTGESQPIAKRPGDTVQAGARNLEGTLTLRVTRTSADSTLSRMIELIAEAQESKPKITRLIDQFGKWYATTILSLAGLFALALPWIWDIPYLGPEGGIYRALSFLIAASPCALILATPTAYLSAISCCARKGILLKGGIVLDSLARARQIAFDKTGTLTTGELTCTEIRRLSGTCPEARALSIAAALERHAVHPIARALTSLAQSRAIQPAEIAQFKSVPGFGLEGHVDSLTVFIGHADYIAQKTSLSLPQTAGITTLLLIGDSLFLFTFTDQIRPGVKELSERLKKRMRLLLLTGDKIENANLVGHELQFDAIYANLRPEDKLTKIAECLTQGDLVMVGDGVNDAPALSRATVGISLGKIGSATAVDASDVVFLNDDLSELDWLLAKARKTTRIIKQNLTLALAVILLATTPALLGTIPLWLAVILHEGGTVLVGLNSLRLLQLGSRKQTSIS